jgi:hypothetical protein
MILMGVSKCQDRDRSRVDSGFRHGLLKTAYSWGPTSPSTIDENSVNAWAGERKAIDGQAKLRPRLRSFAHWLVMRVPQ